MLPNHTDGMRQARRRLGLSLAVLFRGGAASHPYDKGEEYKSQQKRNFSHRSLLDHCLSLLYQVRKKRGHDENEILIFSQPLVHFLFSESVRQRRNNLFLTGQDAGHMEVTVSFRVAEGFFQDVAVLASPKKFRHFRHDIRNHEKRCV